MTDYSPDGKEKKELTEKQQELLDRIWEFNGDAIAAARAVGYSNPYAAADSVAEQLVELAEKAIARLAPKSVGTMNQVLDSEHGVIQASEKLKVCKEILDRSNPKVEKIDVQGQSLGIVILPNKKPLDE